MTVTNEKGLWAGANLESVCCCPMCGSIESSICMTGVYDWAFNCSDNLWTYLRCVGCGTVYLTPRPTVSKISEAYRHYYTHDKSSKSTGFLRYIISFLKKFFRTFSVAEPASRDAAHVAVKKNIILKIIKKFGLDQRSFLDDIDRMVPGKILDVGCGSGQLLLDLPESWIKKGVELDEKAVSFAKSRGLDVVQGSFETLKQIPGEFDCIICAHVIEHIYEPTLMIKLAIDKLSAGGELWVQWPNPNADGLALHGKYWRGFEAPRHITLPSKQSVTKYINLLYGDGFTVSDRSASWAKASIYMRLASRSLEAGKRGSFSTLGHLFEAIRYFSYSRKIENHEFCTLVVKRDR